MYILYYYVFMTIIVSINQFRQNMADYIAKAKEGHTVILKDEKKDQQLVELVSKKTFNPETFERALKAAAGIFTVENHPEWMNKKDIVKWIEESRQTSDRTF